MLYTGLKKEAMEIHRKAVEKYNTTYDKMQKSCENLYNRRKLSLELIKGVEELVNSIANTPKYYEAIVDSIGVEREHFHKTEQYAQEAFEAAQKSGIGVASGIAGGMAVAGMAPTAAMWVATTFGTASTGTAISTLSGAAATKAALAWLGGGAIKMGGAGIAGGKALLALAGPIGWGLAGTATVASVAFLGSKNKKLSEEAMEEAKKITIAGAELNEGIAKVDTLFEETIVLYEPLNAQYVKLKQFEGSDFLTLEPDVKTDFGTLVNNTLSLSEMLNKTV